MNEQQIIDIWDLFKEYIAPKNLDIAANHFVDFLVDQDVELSVIEGLQGMDGHLDDAIKSLVKEESLDEEEDELDFDDEEY
jgi:hypothetical protein